MPELEAVLFDMDGLLVDTEPQWFEVETEVMARLGGQWTAADQAANIGSSMLGTAEYMINRSGAAVDPYEIIQWMNDGIIERVRTDLIVLPGARDLLAEVGARGVPRALVSSSFRRLVDAVLDHVGAGCFEATIAGDEVVRTKPDPEPYLAAAARLGVDPRACVVLEDSPSGVAAGLAAGCVVIAVPQGPSALPAHPRLTVVPSLTAVSADIMAAAVNGSERRGRAGVGLQ